MVGIATKTTDIFVDPLQRLYLVLETVVQAGNSRQESVWADLEGCQLAGVVRGITASYSIAKCNDNYLPATSIDERRTVVIWIGYSISVVLAGVELYVSATYSLC